MEIKTILKLDMMSVEDTTRGITVTASIPNDMKIMLETIKILDDFKDKLIKDIDSNFKDYVDKAPLNSDQKATLVSMRDALKVYEEMDKIIKEGKILDEDTLQKIKDMKNILGGC